MLIFVENYFNSTIHELNFERDDTVEDLTNILCKKEENIDPNLINLIFAGKILSKERKITSYGKELFFNRM